MKKVVITKSEVTKISIEEVSELKIYAFKTCSGVYKLQREGSNGKQKSWGDLSNSQCLWNSIHSDIESAIQSVIDRQTVYQFDTLKEFVEWLVEETK